MDDSSLFYLYARYMNKSADRVFIIDKVYIDRPYELLIRRSMDKLLAKHFCNQEIPGVQSYCKHLSWEIPEPNHTVYALLLLVLFIKVSHVTRAFETSKQNTG